MRTILLTLLLLGAIVFSVGLLYEAINVVLVAFFSIIINTIILALVEVIKIHKSYGI